MCFQAILAAVMPTVVETALIEIALSPLSNSSLVEDAANVKVRVAALESYALRTYLGVPAAPVASKAASLVANRSPLRPAVVVFAHL